jgi:hypothetical protein
VISTDTTASTLSTISSEAKGDPNSVTRLIAEFVVNEPNFCAFITVLNGSLGIKDPTTLAFMALSLYQRMKNSQEAADSLKKSIGE